MAHQLPPPPPEMIRDTDQLRATVARLEQEHKARGVELSGRIVHVCHYLPVIATLASRPTSLLSPPKTPDIVDQPLHGLSPAQPKDKTPRWSLRHRSGHDAMFSGVRSLAGDYEQVVVGWSGDFEAGPQRERVPAANLSDDDRKAFEVAIGSYVDPEHDAPAKGVTYVPVWLDEKIAHGHYEGFSKSTLWPLFHYLLWQDVTHEAAPEEESHWKAYVKANEEYAKRVQSILKPGDLVWVHDYHLLLLPRQLRNLSPDAYIGLFIHTPFPSSEVFRCLPRRKEILDGIVGANLVCFQTYSYARHFISTCIRVCAYESAVNGIDVDGHIVSVMHCAVGVDAARVERDTHRPGIQPKLEGLLTLYEGKKIIVGRDKLDAVKGVLQKLKGFEKLLRDYPQWRGNVVLIQVTSPALSDSPKLERQVSELVAHINGEFGSLDFIPVHHYHQSIGKDEFYALLSAADLALITPLRDGMNTTSMEFVICQEKTKKSPLVLSEFMGISGTMKDALQINPWDIGGLAAAVNQGLTMSAEEKARRQANMHKIVTTHTSATWALALVKMLLSAINTENKAHATPELDRELLKSQYASAKKRLFLFDYDGTLTPIVKTPSAAVPSDATLEALERLSADPKNVVYIISGRDTSFLMQHMGHIKNLGMSAEHGGFLRAPGVEEWTNLAETLDMSWMAEAEEIFRYYTERTTGSFVEIKKTSITWHYRATDPEWGAFQSKQCLDLLENNLAPKRPIEVLMGKKNLEVRPVAINKGEIVKRIVFEHPDAEFIFCAGDDKTDEDMFRALLLFPIGSKTATMSPPVSEELSHPGDGPAPAEPVQLHVKPEGLFPTAVGPSTKRTLAGWHVTSAPEVVEAMLLLVNHDSSA
ncbi:glycosyltransferase family 20 protein [Exidia glandulosa HHB12029]|uniref:Glycosyltransferase family 20 protein n=1 Tax=Exidia glandulosa HHB12029 TaxID=1314781 RepID=A0A165LQ18_EXIGL|nr:glycosyltransferase family 20 protein [Exidia glandulosa HHB12029]